MKPNRQKNSPRRLLALASAHGQAQAARLIVTIQMHPQCRWLSLRRAPSQSPMAFPTVIIPSSTKLKAAAETLSVVFDDLAPGTYAVGAYHDENNNSRLDTDFIATQPKATRCRMRYAR